MPVTVNRTHFQRYFETARERHSIYLRRQAGEPAPWTSDPCFQQFRFCNVFRELDRVTQWFRENIREPLKYNSSVMLATIAFRWWNLPATGEILKPFLLSDTYDLPVWKQLLDARKAAGEKIITGAYIVKTPKGMSKIDGILYGIQEAKMREPRLLQWLRETPSEERTLQELWGILQDFPYIGEFTGYEIVTDLYWTSILKDARDAMTWANPGPGCAAGIGALLHADPATYDRHAPKDREVMMRIMQEFLAASGDPKFWPEDYPAWQMREVEHWFCEYYKHYRGSRGERLKRRFTCHV